MKLVLMELSCFMLVIFVLVEGQSETSVTVPYIKPMLIGRTFDLSKSTIGGDVFDQDTIQLKTTQNFLTTSKFKIVKTKQQVRDVLDVSGQLSLQIMSGAVNIKGEGKYLKETSSSSNFVEVLAKITFETITESIINDPTLKSGWNTNPIGQHYVRGITYGGYLIASLKFEAKSTKDKEDVEAKVSANVKAGTGNVAIEGQFKKLAESVNDISTLSISYVATAPLKNVPTDIDSLIKAITDFPDLIKSTTTGGRGVPIEAHLFPLSELDVKNDKLRFLIDSTTQTSLDELNSKYFDLITTINAIKSFTGKYPLLTDEAEKNLGKFYDRVFAIVVVFNQVIGNLDLRKAGSQFDKAYTAYREGTTGLTGKFKRQFDKLILTKKDMILFSPVPQAYKKNGVLYLKANNSYTAIAQASKVETKLKETKMEIDNIKTQLKDLPIASTETQKFLSVYIKSEGCYDKGITLHTCGYAYIQVNGKEYSRKGRGHNIVVVHPDTGKVTETRQFDTYVSYDPSIEMKNYLNSLPKRRLVLIGVQDSAEKLQDDAIASLESLGGYNILKEFRSSYALIGWTGPGALGATEQVQRKSHVGPSIIAKVIPLPL